MAGAVSVLEFDETPGYNRFFLLVDDRQVG
jgi:hypothetical protein